MRYLDLTGMSRLVTKVSVVTTDTINVSILWCNFDVQLAAILGLEEALLMDPWHEMGLTMAVSSC